MNWFIYANVHDKKKKIPSQQLKGTQLVLFKHLATIVYKRVKASLSCKAHFGKAIQSVLHKTLSVETLRQDKRALRGANETHYKRVFEYNKEEISNETEK